MKHISNVTFGAREMLPDFLAGSTAILFLSLRFSRLHPAYLGARLQPFDEHYSSRVLLVFVDLPPAEAEACLEEVSIPAFHARFATIFAFSNQEVARMLESLCAYQQKSAEVIQSRVEGDKYQRQLEVLKTIKGISQSDAANLLTHFGTLAKVFRAEEAELRALPGIGPKKVSALLTAFREPLPA
jgi:DNA excision repair protein ERCC-1